MSPKRGDLFNAAITMNNSTQALYITCKYAVKEKFKLLEDEWVMISSHIGKKEEMPFGKCWNEINSAILDIINSDEFLIEQALLCTTKLMLLNKRDSKKATLKHVQNLRNEVIGSFPEKATLSESGKQTFKDILPPINDDLYAFYNRILAGFSKMIADDNYEDMRMGLEYISRKKLVLPVPYTFTRWPIIDIKDDDFDIHLIINDGDPCWFLWAMLFCVYPNNKNVATNFKLFCQNWRKNAKVERNGLLWGIPFIIDDYSDLIWTADDKEIFQKVKNNTNELWTYTVNEHQNNKKCKDEKANKKKLKDRANVGGTEGGDDASSVRSNGSSGSNRSGGNDIYGFPIVPASASTNAITDHQSKLTLFGSFIPRKVATNIYANNEYIDPYDKLVESINYGVGNGGIRGNVSGSYENTTKMVRVNNKLIPNEQKKPNMLVNKV